MNNLSKKKKKKWSSSDITQNEENEGAGVEEAVVSMHAMSSKPNPQTMRFQGHVGSKPVLALIDSGSTHSFIHPEVLEGIECNLLQTHPMVVTVSNGERMQTATKASALPFAIQGHTFQAYLMLLNVTGYDIIIGLDWLIQLGPMKVDWGRRSIELNKEGKMVKLRVEDAPAEINKAYGWIN